MSDRGKKPLFKPSHSGAKPGVSKPGVPKAGISKPGVSKAMVSKSNAPKVEVSQPGVSKAEASKPAPSASNVKTFQPHKHVYPLDSENCQAEVIWVTSCSLNFKRLAKVVVREICGYLAQETTLVYAIRKGFLYIYDLQTGQGREQHFVPLAPVRFPSYFSSARLGNTGVFCCGGECNFYVGWRSYYDREVCNDAYVLNFDGSVQGFTPMMRARSGHGLVVFNRRAYVFGGGFDCFRETEESVACESLSFVSGRWSTLPSMRFSRRVCFASRLQDRVYLYGRPHLQFEIFWFFTNRITATDFSLPGISYTSTIVKGGCLVILTYACRVTVSHKEKVAMIDVTEEFYPRLMNSFSVYWKGKMYSQGDMTLRCISDTDVNNFETIYWSDTWDDDIESLL